MVVNSLALNYYYQSWILTTVEGLNCIHRNNSTCKLLKDMEVFLLTLLFFRLIFTM